MCARTIFKSVSMADSSVLPSAARSCSKPRAVHVRCVSGNTRIRRRQATMLHLSAEKARAVAPDDGVLVRHLVLMKTIYDGLHSALNIHGSAVHSAGSHV